jgi:hypothetical protein
MDSLGDAANLRNQAIALKTCWIPFLLGQGGQGVSE